MTDASEQQLSKLVKESSKASKLTPAKIPSTLFSRLSFWKSSDVKRHLSARKVSFDITHMSKILSVVAACFFVYVLFDVVASAKNFQNPPSFAQSLDMKVVFNKEAVEPLKESSYYLQKVSARDIFVEGKKVEPAKPAPIAQDAVTGTPQAIKDLTLVGISWSQDPDVIIEDIEHQRTFFVKRGQMVADSVKVEAIFKDRVVVLFEGVEYELK